MNSIIVSLLLVVLVVKNQEPSAVNQDSLAQIPPQLLENTQSALALQSIEFPKAPRITEVATTESYSTSALAATSTTLDNTSNHATPTEIKVNKSASSSPVNFGKSEFNQSDIAQVQSQNAVEQLNQVKGLSSGAFQINLPPATAERKAVERFLYQCVGVGFASLQSSNQLDVIVNVKHDASSILRVVSGELLPNENRYTKIYDVKRPVRVYPMWVDMVMAKYLTIALDGKKLTGFSADYKVQNNLLLLDNVVINGEPSAYVWTLVDGFRQGCPSFL